MGVDASGGRGSWLPGVALFLLLVEVLGTFLIFGAGGVVLGRFSGRIETAVGVAADTAGKLEALEKSLEAQRKEIVDEVRVLLDNLRDDLRPYDLGKQAQRVQETEQLLKRLEVRINRIRTQNEILLDRGDQDERRESEP